MYKIQIQDSLFVKFMYNHDHFQFSIKSCSLPYFVYYYIDLHYLRIVICNFILFYTRLFICMYDAHLLIHFNHDKTHVIPDTSLHTAFLNIKHTTIAGKHLL